MPRSRTINSMEEWSVAEEYLRSNGFSLFQTQYDTDLPQGYQVRFMHPFEDKIEIITFNPDVRVAILKSGI